MMRESEGRTGRAMDRIADAVSEMQKVVVSGQQSNFEVIGYLKEAQKSDTIKLERIADVQRSTETLHKDARDAHRIQIEGIKGFNDEAKVRANAQLEMLNLLKGFVPQKKGNP
jgi:hypothetical protein